MRYFIIVFTTTVLFFAQSIVSAFAADIQLPDIGFKALTEFSQLPLLVDWQTYQDSSYSRARQNADAGVYIRTEENGELVMMDAEGPGCIYRIWGTGATGTTHPHPDVRIKFYFDGEPNPRFDFSAQQLFGDKGAQFPFIPPLSLTFGSGFGPMEGPASICYVPIPFAKHLKITTNGQQFYHIDYIKFPAGTSVESFSNDYAQKNRAIFDKASGILTSRGQMPDPPKEPMTSTDVVFDILPGQTALLYEGTGPGIVRELKILPKNPDDLTNRGLVLLIEYDGSGKNSINCPIGDFFGVTSHTMRYRSLPMGRTESGYYCYFPMPYRSKIRIAVRNDTANNASIIGSVKVHKVAILPVNAGYLHAEYRQSKLTPTGVDYTILDTQGGRGKYVGCYIIMQSAPGQGGVNFLEGDETIYVDDEIKWPSRFVGTGTEDYFNGSYYWNAVDPKDMDKPFGGILFRDDNLRRVCAYRWHVTDFIAFQKRVKVDLEHGGVSEWPDDYSSVGFWYMDKPVDAVAIPPLDQRKLRTEIMTGGVSAPMMMGCEFRGAFSSEGAQLEMRRQPDEAKVPDNPLGIGVGMPYIQHYCKAKDIGQEIKGKLYVPGEDAYQMNAFFAVGPNYGKFSVYIGGQYVGTVDMFSEIYHPAKLLSVGTVILKEGEHDLVFRAEGKDENATGMDFGLIAWQSTAKTAALIRKWRLCGPFPCPKEGGWDTANPPEREINFDTVYEVSFDGGKNKSQAKWMVLDLPPNAGVASGGFYGQFPWQCCYAVTYIWAPKDMVAGAFIAKDDALRIWINDQVVFNNNSWSHYLGDQFIAACPLKAGWNKMLVKNGNWDGMWAFAIRLTDINGELKFSNEKPAQ